MENQDVDFRKELEATLPEFWERSLTTELTRGVVHAATLANMMVKGLGPAGTYRVGRKVVLTKAPFIDWLVSRIEPTGYRQAEEVSK